MAVPVVVAALLFLPLIGQRTLSISDEARYALLARNMVEHGHWLVPHIGAEAHLEKPPGYAWAIALIALLQGGEVTELAAVLPAALSGIAAVGLTVALGLRLFGPLAGAVAGLVLATSFGFFIHARMALADMTVTACVVGSLWAFWCADIDRARAGRFIALFYGFLAIGLSAKGPFALMPVVVVAVLLVGDGGWRRLLDLRPATGLPILGAIVSPWAIAFALHPENYMEEVVVGDFGVHFGFWDGVHEAVFALGPLGLEFLPWAVLVPAAVVGGYVHAPDETTRRRFRFLIGWALAYVVPVTLSSHKRDRYLLAVFPALALMVGWLIAHWHGARDGRGPRVPVALCGLTAVAMAIALLLPLPVPRTFSSWFPPTAWAALPAAAVLGAGAAGWAIAARAGRIVAGFVVLALSMSLVLAYVTRFYVPRYSAANDVKRFSRLLNERVPREAPLVSFAYSRLSIDLYARREPMLLRDTQALAGLLAHTRDVYVFSDPRGWRAIDAAKLGAWEPLAEVRLAGRVVTLARSR